MRWTSVMSELADPVAAAVAAAGDARAAMGPEPVDLVFAFLSIVHATYAEAALGVIQEAFPGATVVGCGASGVSGGGAEKEHGGATVLMVGRLPDVGCRAFHVPPLPAHSEEGVRPLVAHAVGVDPDLVSCLVVFSDPFTMASDAAVLALQQVFPRVPVVGGLVSGGRQPGEHRLLCNGEVHTRGMVGLALWGDVALDVVVAQGARPIGPVFRVSDADPAGIRSLDGKPATEALQIVYESLDPVSRVMFRRAPLMGFAMEPHLSTLRRGDFLVRQIVGLDRQERSVRVAHRTLTGDRVRFHVRDAATSSEDLRELVTRYATRHGDAAAGVLMFSCLGRGEGLYGTPHHDTEVIREVLGDLAIGGFFANGEIGPVHGRVFTHAYTNVLGVLRGRSWN